MTERFIADVLQDLDMCGTQSVCAEAAKIIRDLIKERDELQADMDMCTGHGNDN